MGTHDLVGIIEAAYESEGTDRVWLRKIVDTATPLLERGLGLTGYLVDMRKTGPRPHSPVTIGGPRGWRPLWKAMNVPGRWDREIEEVYRNQLPYDPSGTRTPRSGCSS